MDENDIPFPLLSGQYISTSQGTDRNRTFWQIVKQPSMFDLSFSYEIAAGLSLADQTITNGTGSGAISVFKTSVPGLKQWVTWIDNDYLGVKWALVDINMNSLSGFTRPLTKYTSPFGSVNFPMFILNNPSGNVTFTLENLSTTKTIAGTLHILMYEYTIRPAASAPSFYTDIEYKSGGTS